MGIRATCDEIIDRLGPKLVLLIIYGVCGWCGILAVYWCASEVEIYRTFNIAPPKEFNHCILRRMPGTANAIVFQAVVAKCGQFPEKPHKLGYFYNMTSAEDCVIRFGNRTEEVSALNEIQTACYALMWSVKDRR